MFKVVSFVGFVLAAAAAQAGAHRSFPVFIDLVNRHHAAGAFGDARNSADGHQLLECSTTSTPVLRYGMCIASDAEGNIGYCYTNSANHVAAIDSLDSDSGILLFWDPKTSECEQISVLTSSLFQPKQ